MTDNQHAFQARERREEFVAMRLNCAARMLAITAGLLCAPGFALAQTATTPPSHVPLQKTIGQAKPEVVPSLIVMNARGASLEGSQLTLTGVAPNSIMFADRPVRAAGHALTSHLLEEWSPGDESSDSFAKDPPNATVSVFTKDGSAIRDAVVVLRTPKLEGDRLTFDVQVLEGSLAGADGPASVFIDRFGGHFGGVGRIGGFDHAGFAGVARRTAYRGAWYRGAAVGAAVGAAAVAAPYYQPNQCGYYPYPPCY